MLNYTQKEPRRLIKIDLEKFKQFSAFSSLLGKLNSCPKIFVQKEGAKMDSRYNFGNFPQITSHSELNHVFQNLET